MSRPQTLVKQVHFPHPPEAVWIALTDPRALAEWLMPNTFRAEVGAEFRFQTDPNWACKSAYTQCRVIELETARRMVWSWRDVMRDGTTRDEMVITWTLTAERGGTTLQLEQTNCGVLTWLERRFMSWGWSGMLRDKLTLVLRNVQGGVFTPGAVPLNKRFYKARTVPPEFVR